jgi:hypothetical protein
MVLVEGDTAIRCHFFVVFLRGLTAIMRGFFLRLVRRFKGNTYLRGRWRCGFIRRLISLSFQQV